MKTRSLNVYVLVTMLFARTCLALFVKSSPAFLDFVLLSSVKVGKSLMWYYSWRPPFGHTLANKIVERIVDWHICNYLVDCQIAMTRGTFPGEILHMPARSHETDGEIPF